MADKLTAKQERFVQEYLVDLNGKQAAIRAGYSVRRAEVTASELLALRKVSEVITAAQKTREELTKATASDVLQEITRLAMFDPADLADVKGPQDIKALPVDVRRAIVGWSYDRQGRFQLKTAKEGALEMMARHYSLFRDKVAIGGADDMPPIKHDLKRLTAAELATMEALAAKVAVKE